MGMVAEMKSQSSLNGREAVLAVLEDLQRELDAGVPWENEVLVRFLEAFHALLGSIENSYENSGVGVPDDPWVIVADALRGARNYE